MTPRLEIFNPLGVVLYAGRCLGVVHKPSGTVVVLLCDDGRIREAAIGWVRAERSMERPDVAP